MVDAERISSRLAELERLIERLEGVRDLGEGVYLQDIERQAMTERWLQLAIQICIDVGAQLSSELSAQPPSDYGGVFTSLADAGHLDRELADRLAAAARLRNLLVHAYLDLDSRQVFAALARLGDLREFAVAVQRIVASDAADDQ